MNKRENRKRFANIIFYLSYVLFFLGIVILFIAAFLRRLNYDVKSQNISLASALLVGVLGLIMYHWGNTKRILYWEEDLPEQYKINDIKSFRNMYPERIQNILKSFHFYKRDSFLCLNKNGLNREITYLAKRISTENLESDITELRYMISHFELLGRNWKNSKCALLFVYKKSITSQDLEQLLKLELEIMIDEKRYSAESLVIVLIDSFTYDGYFVDVKYKRDMSVYAHGCRFLKKMFMS